MANFHTHIGTSSTLGLAIAAGGYVFLDYPLVSCALAGGLCGIAGMLPDVDSDNGVPLREMMAFLAAVVPLMAMERAQEYFGTPLLEPEPRILAAGGLYLCIRFLLADLIRRTTVHRGMWHSIPAAGIAGLMSFYLCGCHQLNLCAYKVLAVVLGYLSHLVLDEMYSVEEKRGRFRVKRSFGTALKWWGPSYIANVTTYGLLLMIGTTVLGDPLVQQGLQPLEQAGNGAPNSDLPEEHRPWSDSADDRTFPNTELPTRALPNTQLPGRGLLTPQGDDSPALPWSVAAPDGSSSSENYSSQLPTRAPRRSFDR